MGIQRNKIMLKSALIIGIIHGCLGETQTLQYTVSSYAPSTEPGGPSEALLSISLRGRMTCASRTGCVMKKSISGTAGSATGIGSAISLQDEMSVLINVPPFSAVSTAETTWGCSAMTWTMSGVMGNCGPALKTSTTNLLGWFSSTVTASLGSQQSAQCGDGLCSVIATYEGRSDSLRIMNSGFNLINSLVAVGGARFLATIDGVTSNVTNLGIEGLSSRSAAGTGTLRYSFLRPIHATSLNSRDVVQTKTASGNTGPVFYGSNEDCIVKSSSGDFTNMTYDPTRLQSSTTGHMLGCGATASGMVFTMPPSRDVGVGTGVPTLIHGSTFALNGLDILVYMIYDIQITQGVSLTMCGLEGESVLPQGGSTFTLTSALGGPCLVRCGDSSGIYDLASGSTEINTPLVCDTLCVNGQCARTAVSTTADHGELGLTDHKVGKASPDRRWVMWLGIALSPFVFAFTLWATKKLFHSRYMYDNHPKMVSRYDRVSSYMLELTVKLFGKTLSVQSSATGGTLAPIPNAS
jgi:hypothetical protein